MEGTPKRKWWPIVVWIATLVPLLYVLSIGPVTRYWPWCDAESNGDEWFYTPLYRLAEEYDTFDDILAAYLGWWTK